MAEPEGRGWAWFAAFRRLAVFGLGVVVIVSALIDPESDNTISMLIIGMIMIGVLPLDDVISTMRRVSVNVAKANGLAVHDNGPPTTKVEGPRAGEGVKG